MIKSGAGAAGSVFLKVCVIFLEGEGLMINQN